MQRLAPLAIAVTLSLPALGPAAAGCGPTDMNTLAGRASLAVEITIRTPGGQPAHGTGIIWNERGHIVTNDHVASVGDQHVVTLAGGERRAARVLARAPQHDLAVLAVDGPLPAPAPRKTTAALRAGESVLAVGNPFGRGMSVASGAVTGFGRDVITAPDRRLTGMIETTTPLSPGNSGGPLLTCRGEVVGINTAAVAQGPSGTPLGFAIPIDQAAAVVDRLLESSTVVTAASSPAERTERPGLGLYVVPNGQALVVHQVVPGSPAARAGAMPGDAIIEANGRLVSSPADLQALVHEAGTGTVAVLRIVRYGSQLDMAVRITPVVFSS